MCNLLYSTTILKIVFVDHILPIIHLYRWLISPSTMHWGYLNLDTYRTFVVLCVKSPIFIIMRYCTINLRVKDFFRLFYAILKWKLYLRKAPFFPCHYKKRQCSIKMLFIFLDITKRTVWRDFGEGGSKARSIDRCCFEDYP